MGLFWKNQSTSSWSPPYLGFHPTIMLIVVWIGTWSMIPNIRKMVYEMLEMRAAEFETPRETSRARIESCLVHTKCIIRAL